MRSFASTKAAAKRRERFLFKSKALMRRANLAWPETINFHLEVLSESISHQVFSKTDDCQTHHFSGPEENPPMFICSPDHLRSNGIHHSGPYIRTLESRPRDPGFVIAISQQLACAVIEPPRLSHRFQRNSKQRKGSRE